MEVWPTPEGTLHFPALDDVRAAQRVESVLEALSPGALVVISDRVVRDGLLGQGAQEVRHMHTMRHDLRDLLPTHLTPDLSLRPWESGDAERLAAVLVAGYGPGHPDSRGPDLGEAAASLVHMVDDPDNPLMKGATQVALIRDRPMGAALVLRSEHVDRWRGPWLMNMFRAPDPTAPGVGAAMLTRALDALRAAGESHLGLAVTVTNPARRVYERLGFQYGFEGWVLVLPITGATPA